MALVNGVQSWYGFILRTLCPLMDPARRPYERGFFPKQSLSNEFCRGMCLQPEIILLMTLASTFGSACAIPLVCICTAHLLKIRCYHAFGNLQKEKKVSVGILMKNDSDPTQMNVDKTESGN